MNLGTPGLMQVAEQAQNMAKGTQQEKVAMVFQTVAVVSMALMGVTAGAHLIRELLRSQTVGRGR
jgi:hypothetical protein